MNKTNKNKLIMAVRVDQFMKDNVLTPPIPRATVLVTEIEGGIAQMQTLGGTQDTGQAEALGGTDERQQVAAELRKLMRKVARTAKVLDPEVFPGVRRQLRVPNGTSYQPLHDRALTFIEVVTPAALKTAMVDRGLPADFAAQIQTKIDALAAATGRKYGGLGQQVNGTASIATTARKLVKAVRELDAIVRLKYEDDPGLLTEWESVSHIERPPRKKKAKAAKTSKQVKSDQGVGAAGVNSDQGMVGGGKHPGVVPPPVNA